MAVELTTIVWEQFRGHPTEKLVLLALADHADKVTHVAWPSIATIAQEVGLQKCQARRLVHKLIDKGLVEVIDNEFGGKPGSSRRYRLRLERLAEATAQPDVHSLTHTGVPEATRTPVLEDRDGCTPVPETGVLPYTQTISEPSDNHQRCARELEVTCRVNHISRPNGQRLQKWVAEGVTNRLLREAIARARVKKPEPERIPFNYIVPIVEELRRGPLPKVDNSWRKDPEMAEKKGRELGIKARAGEDLPAFVRRVDEVLHKRHMERAA